MTEATEKKLWKFVRELGRLIQAEVGRRLAAQKAKDKAKLQVDTPPWVSAFLDVRWYADAEGWKAKLRVVLPEGTLFSVRTSDEMDDLVRKLSSLRKEEPPAGWYGLKVTVNYDGEVATELDNDPNCVVDPAWWK